MFGEHVRRTENATRVRLGANDSKQAVCVEIGLFLLFVTILNYIFRLNLSKLIKRLQGDGYNGGVVTVVLGAFWDEAK